MLHTSRYVSAQNYKRKTMLSQVFFPVREILRQISTSSVLRGLTFQKYFDSLCSRVHPSYGVGGLHACISLNPFEASLRTAPPFATAHTSCGSRDGPRTSNFLRTTPTTTFQVLAKICFSCIVIKGAKITRCLEAPPLNRFFTLFVNLGKKTIVAFVDWFQSKDMRFLIFSTDYVCFAPEFFNPLHSNNAYLLKKHRSCFYELLLV